MLGTASFVYYTLKRVSATMKLFAAVIVFVAGVLLAMSFLPFVQFPEDSSSNEVEADFGSSSSEVQYGIVIDAGSSGSRVYVFTWLPHDPLTTLVEVVHKKVAPGISAYVSNPVDAVESIWQLLEFASTDIPHSILSCCLAMAIRTTDINER